MSVFSSLLLIICDVCGTVTFHVATQNTTCWLARKGRRKVHYQSIGDTVALLLSFIESTRKLLLQEYYCVASVAFFTRLKKMCLMPVINMLVSKPLLFLKINNHHDNKNNHQNPNVLVTVS